jgi:hypothetical protein
VWRTIGRLAKDAKSRLVATPYFGTGGASILPLGVGDVLVVDVSLGAVKSGVTNPSELLKLHGRGVRIHSHSRLHAKVFVFDDEAVVGSSNVSMRSRDALEEAAIRTSDKQAVAAARRFVEELVKAGDGEVSEEYLLECVKHYRPPRGYMEHVTDRGRPRKKAAGARGRKGDDAPALWLVSGIHDKEIPEAERAKAELATEQAKALVHKRTPVTYLHFGSDEPWVRDAVPGDSIAICWTDPSGRQVVFEPQRVVCVKRYRRAGGKHRYLVFYEERKGCREKPVKAFIRALKAADPGFSGNTRIRTRAIRDASVAQRVRKIWRQ